MTGTNCDLFIHKSSRSYLNHLVLLKHVATYILRRLCFQDRSRRNGGRYQTSKSCAPLCYAYVNNWCTGRLCEKVCAFHEYGPNCSSRSSSTTLGKGKVTRDLPCRHWKGAESELFSFLVTVNTTVHCVSASNMSLMYYIRTGNKFTHTHIPCPVSYSNVVKWHQLQNP